MLSRGVHAEGPYQPKRLPLQKSLHVFAPNQGNVFAETLPKLHEEPVTMVCFLLAHLFKHVRRRRIGFPQRVGKLTKNSPVFLLVLDGQRQNLLFRQVLELFLHCSPVTPERQSMLAFLTAVALCERSRIAYFSRPSHFALLP